MRRAKFKPNSTLIVQMMAHNEVECIITEDNKVFVELPTPDLGGVSVPKKSKDEEEDDAPAPAKKSAPEKTEKAEKSSGKVYTEKELMDIDVKELTKMCAKMDIEIPEDGKRNTNAKLRALILDAQGGPSKKSKEVDEEEDAPKSKKVGSPLEKKVLSLLEDFDKGELSEKKLRVALADEGIEEELIDETIDEMNDDDKAPLGKFAAKLAGGEAEAPAKKSRKSDDDDDDAPKAKKEKTVSIDELEEGDKIKAYWVEEKEWFEGEVSKIKGNKVYVDWEDGTNDFLDEEFQTKIVLL